jgi:hypothetical protein
VHALTEGEIKPKDVREFCAKHAFKIGTAFSDESIQKWISMGLSSSKRCSSEGNELRTWVLAFACRECCEHGPDGPDHVGFAHRKSFFPKFDEMMRRHEC